MSRTENTREYWATKPSGIPRSYDCVSLWSIEAKPQLKSHESVGVVDGAVAVVSTQNWQSDDDSSGQGDIYENILGMGAEPKIARIRIEILDD